jgi:hypothetical protein
MDVKEKIKEICKSALLGEFSGYDLSLYWPDGTLKNPWFLQIFQDVEEFVVHIPGGKSNRERWFRTSYYYRLYLDSILLEYDKPFEELLSCREKIGKNIKNLKTRALIELEIKKFFSSKSES